MNYQKIYDSIIHSARNKKFQGYTESHHIIPVCMGGSNNKENLVELSARQHFICHWLLFKIHKTAKLAYAWNAMCMNFSKKRYSSKSFSYAREEWAKRIAIANVGKTVSPESKQKMALAKIGKPSWNAGISAPWKTKNRVAYEKTPKLCLFCKNPIRYKQRNIRKYCSNSCAHLDPEKKKSGSSIPNCGSFKIGHKLNPESVKLISLKLTGLKRERGCCIFCKKEASVSLLRRWHFENCRNKA